MATQTFGSSRHWGRSVLVRGDHHHREQSGVGLRLLLLAVAALLLLAFGIFRRHLTHHDTGASQMEERIEQRAIPTR